MANKPICTECGRLMGKSGRAWSGRHLVQRYKCAGCGKVIYGQRIEKKGK